MSEYFWGECLSNKLIKKEIEFQAMLAEIKADMVNQLQRAKEMEQGGDVCANL